MYAPMCINQNMIRPRKIGYKYKNIINVKDSIDLRIPLGGSGESSNKNIYGIDICNGSL